MKKNSRKTIGFNLFEVIIIIIVSSLLTAIATGIIVVNKNRTSSGITYAELLEDDKVREFLDVYAKVVNSYYENINKNEAIDSAIDGMMSYLGDEYTTFMDDNDSSALNNKLSGTYTGIGISVGEDKMIREVFANSPAEKAGLLENDYIIAVNSESVKEIDLTGISEKIKNSDNKVNITVIRDNQELSFDIAIDTLNIPAVSSKVLVNNIGYLQISSFSNTVYDQVNVELKRLEDEGIDKLILDLRSNGGGYLYSANEIANMFLDKGQVIYSLEDRKGTKVYKDDTSENRDYQIVVLVNSSSASASEILAAALKDSYGATIVGNKTYGKGKVQQTIALEDGSMVKYTTAKWIRPNGECIDEVGIIPDYEVNLLFVRNGQGELMDIRDTQLEKAVELLSN